MDAEKTVRETIEKRRLIPKGSHVILALSGGADSLCLLHILSSLRAELEFSLSCVHLNHLMRGEAASADEEWLKAECAKLSVPLSIARCDVVALAEAEGITVEEAGRKARYGALSDKREKLRGEGFRGEISLAFAHNRDDQAETVLLRILRGTGVHGLAAMEYKRKDGVIRPLLDTSRAAIEEFCAVNTLDPRWDYTNESREFTRNKLRLELLPALEKEYNPSLKAGLARLADMAGEDDEFLEAAAETLIADADLSNRPHIPLKSLQDAHRAVGKRAIKMILAHIGLDEDIAHAHLEAAWSLLERGKTGTKALFPEGYYLEISYENVIFYSPEGGISEGGDSKFKTAKSAARSGESPTEVSHGIDIDSSLAKGASVDVIVMDKNAAPDPKEVAEDARMFDADKLRECGTLVLRTRMAGDYIKPLGLSGTKKLKNYFIDEKIPREEREKTLLLCTKNRLIWIENGPIDEDFKVAPDTCEIAILKIRRQP